MASYILAIDQGTTSSRAILFDDHFAEHGVGQQEIKQYYPKPGWVEHDPHEILQSCVDSVFMAIEKSHIKPAEIEAIGITNQRETTIIWDKSTGKPIYNAIVWQDRRTADYCKQLKDDGLEDLFCEKTGLLLDPYFSASKISWLLNNVEGARKRAENGELLFGTVDSWLLWNLSNGKTHATDATNASRTLLYNITEQCWDDELLAIFDIPRQILPDVRDCAADYGKADTSWFGAEIPVYGIAGDQHAATLGQACFQPGMMKSTYGTGCFAMLNTGKTRVPSSNRLLSTIAYRLDGKTTYALEGSIFMAGASVQWLRDGLGIIQRADQCDTMAQASDPDQEVYLVPAFTGMGAPYWDAEARGLICGLTRASGANEIVRATLEAVCYQTADLLSAMKDDWHNSEARQNTEQIKTVLRVDGGMSASNWTMQFLADILNAEVDRPEVLETTALGAAWLAGYYAGVWDNADGFSQHWQLNRQFKPQMDQLLRDNKFNGWKDAIKRTLIETDN